LKGKGENQSDQLITSRFQNQSIVKLASEERRGNSQLGDVILMFCQILETLFKRNL